MNASRRARISNKNSARQPQLVRPRPRSRSRNPLAEYIRNGARAISEALNTISTAFSHADSRSRIRNLDVVVRYSREQISEGDFHEATAPDIANATAVNDPPENAGDIETGLHNAAPYHTGAPGVAGPRPLPPAAPNAQQERVLEPVPIARRAVQRRHGAPLAITAPRTLRDAGFRPTALHRGTTLRREGAFHEHWMPEDAPERQQIGGRSHFTLSDNLVWEEQWGPVPTLSDVTGNDAGPLTPERVLGYLNARFLGNNHAYRAAIFALFPYGARESLRPEAIRREPAFSRVVPTAQWRQDPDWEGGIVPVDREWGSPQADDAADPETEPFEPDESDEDSMPGFTDEELLAIQDHISACLAARHAIAGTSRQSPASLTASSSSQLCSTSLPGPSSITLSRSSPKRSRGKKANTRAGGSSAPKRLGWTSCSRTQASARRLDRRNVARAWLREKIRKHLKKAPRFVVRELAGEASAGPSSLRSAIRVRVRPEPRARAPGPSESVSSTGAPAAADASPSPSRQLRSRKRAREEDEGEAQASPKCDAPRSKGSRRY